MLNCKQQGEMRLIGCNVHGRTRKKVKEDYTIYSVWQHCWCGYDLQTRWIGVNRWEFVVFEKTYCTPEKHYRQYPECHFLKKYSNRSREDVQCGWHGLRYDHCRLCVQPIEGEVLGTVNGKWKFAPLNLAKKILQILKS